MFLKCPITNSYISQTGFCSQSFRNTHFGYINLSWMFLGDRIRRVIFLFQGIVIVCNSDNKTGEVLGLLHNEMFVFCFPGFLLEKEAMTIGDYSALYG